MGDSPGTLNESGARVTLRASFLVFGRSGIRGESTRKKNNKKWKIEGGTKKKEAVDQGNLGKSSQLGLREIRLKKERLGKV